MSGPVTIRRGDTHDAALLAALEQACALAPRSEEVLQQELASPAYAYFVAEMDEAAVGYLGLGLLAGEAHIMTVGVVKSWRRRHVGRALMSHALHWCDKVGVADVTLEVGARNTAARALYEAAGFIAEGLRFRYYADGDDAVIMWKRGS